MAKPWKKHLRGSNGSILRGRRSSDAAKNNEDSPTSNGAHPLRSQPTGNLGDSYQEVEALKESSTEEEEAEEHDWKPASAPPAPAVKREEVIPSQFTPTRAAPAEPKAAPPAPPPASNVKAADLPEHGFEEESPRPEHEEIKSLKEHEETNSLKEREHALHQQEFEEKESRQDDEAQLPRQERNGKDHRNTVIYRPNNYVQEETNLQDLEDATRTPAVTDTSKPEVAIPALESELEESTSIQIVEKPIADEPPAYSQAEVTQHPVQAETEYENAKLEYKDVPAEDFDVVIVGAGISGINMAYRLQEQLKGKSYVIIERRANLGGTWDLMKYPGIRSDSDLHTFGFPWKPWPYSTPIATGPLIVDYLKQCTREEGIDEKIRYQHRLVNASWLTRDQAWTLSVEATEANGHKTSKRFRGKFVVLGTGYYDYDKPLEATIPGIESFKGRVVHPQFWPEDLEYTDKKVAVIGSGATAVTMIPAMAEKVEKVTMVQRSPTYIVSVPNKAPKLPWFIRWFIPEVLRRKLLRLAFLLVGLYLRKVVSKGGPRITNGLRDRTIAQLPPHIPYDPHFKPTYKPWAQRMCFCPDGDFYKALQSGKADVKTGNIKTITASGVEMDNGDFVEADIIVTATGLSMKYGGNATYTVDGEEVVWGSKFMWRGIMVQDLPSICIVMGYTKNSWTLGADATATMMIRMIKHLDKHGYESATPRIPAQNKDMVKITTAPGLMGLTSTYIMSALKVLPKSSDQAPWHERGNYWIDIWDAMFASLDKGMQFVKKPGA